MDECYRQEMREEGRESGVKENSQVKKLVTHRNRNLCSAWVEGGSQWRPC